MRTVNTILKVRLGEYDVSTTAEPLKHEEFNISDIVIHPGFNNSTLVHDIALLRLEKPAKRKQVCNNLVTFFEKSLGFSAKLHIVLSKDLAKFEPFLCKTGLV